MGDARLPEAVRPHLASPFKSQARLEAEIVVLGQQLMVLHRRSPSKPKLTVSDRLLSLALSAVSVGIECYRDHPARDRPAMVSVGAPLALALEVALARQSAKSASGDPASDPRRRLLRRNDQAIAAGTLRGTLARQRSITM